MFVWVGKGASKDERAKGMQYGHVSISSTTPALGCHRISLSWIYCFSLQSGSAVRSTLHLPQNYTQSYLVDFDPEH